MNVVCINIDRSLYVVDEKLLNPIVNLTIGSIYYVKRFIDLKKDHSRYLITDDKDTDCYFYANRFIGVKEYRKIKLEKILSL
jgi:hypothetical protein